MTHLELADLNSFNQDQDVSNAETSMGLQSDESYANLMIQVAINEAKLNMLGGFKALETSLDTNFTTGLVGDEAAFNMR
jgi:hypothetical protein